LPFLEVIDALVSVFNRRVRNIVVHQGS